MNLPGNMTLLELLIIIVGFSILGWILQRQDRAAKAAYIAEVRARRGHRYIHTEER